jgi:hypothetical protein
MLLNKGLAGVGRGNGKRGYDEKTRSVLADRRE